MAYSVVRYSNALKKLMPRGQAWEGLANGLLGALIEALAKELNRFDQTVDNFLNKESFPATATELLSSWERVLGLPDECTPKDTTLTLAERQGQIIAKLTNVGGQSASTFIQVARSLGYDGEVQEFKRFRAGKSKSGDKCYSLSWLHVWALKSPASTRTVFRAGQNRAGDKLRVFRNDLIECMITKLKPAHTRVLFRYIIEE